MGSKYIYPIALLLGLAGGMLSTACTADPAEEEVWEDQTVDGGKGSVVISYSLSGDKTTRGTTPANQLISSLHYYVYAQDETNSLLVKKRKIRGIDATTSWPIGDRSKMPWNLRQDLQDTLQNGMKYRILFIANIDPSLFDKVKDDQGNQVEQTIVTGDEVYENARIHLPQEPFKENNLFFMWEGELDRTKASRGRETVKRNDVVLRRIVTRTDFKRKAEEVTDAEIRTALERDITPLYVYPYVDAEIDQIENSHLKEFCDEIQDQIIDVIDHIRWPFDGNGKEGDILKKFLQSDIAKNLIKTDIKKKLVNKYTTQLGGATPLKPWDGSQTVTVGYAEPGKSNAIGMDRKVYKIATTGPEEYKYPLNAEKSFTIYGLSDSNATSQLDQMNRWSFEGPSPFVPFTIQYDPFKINQKLNTWNTIIFNPLKSLTLKDGYTKTSESMTINLNDIFKGVNVKEGLTWEGLMSTEEQALSKTYIFHKYIEDYIFTKKSYNGKWGKDFAHFKIIFSDKDGAGTLPDLSDVDNNVIFIPEWTVTSQN